MPGAFPRERSSEGEASPPVPALFATLCLEKVLYLGKPQDRTFRYPLPSTLSILDSHRAASCCRDSGSISNAESCQTSHRGDIVWLAIDEMVEDEFEIFGK